MNQPTVFDKLKLGFMMGGTVGACLGSLIGIYATMKSGPGPRGYLASIGQYALTSGATFGFFMSIGSVIRTQGTENINKRDIAVLQEYLFRKSIGKPEYASLYRGNQRQFILSEKNL
ncbi:hypothetical protein BB558_005132 [Smittium angustum]|uniref:Protein MGR2 n=1 Tax=Smittium angustum TaxID=133377 RepID=A0A2U1J1C4_SMIAN|nr:hypothetical protein BB558_005132 [Smittium angustum]